MNPTQFLEILLRIIGDQKTKSDPYTGNQAGYETAWHYGMDPGHRMGTIASREGMQMEYEGRQGQRRPTREQPLGGRGPDLEAVPFWLR